MLKQKKILQSLILILVLVGSSYGQYNNEIVVYSQEDVNGTTYGYRIPSLLTTAKGTLLAFAERRVGFHDHAQNDIVLKRSEDNGQSWHKMQVIADYGKSSLNDPLAVELKSGRILLMFKE